MAPGQGRYYLDLAREDYYLDGGEPPGKWWGDAALHLGLEDTVTAASLKSLLTGRGPAGEPLVQNAGMPGRRPGFDLTFSAPKSVSVLWSAAPERMRQAIQEAQQAAVTEALRFIQETATFVRRGKGGLTQVPATLVVATFEHGTSRALDPQLHTHSLVMNVTLGADGRFGSLDARQLYQIKMTAGAAYRAELSAQLERRLGLKSVRKKSWFELEGIPEKLVKTFSSRRGAIELELKSVGLETASAAAAATLKTRPIKEVVPPRGELFSSWRKTAREHGFSLRQVAALCRRAPKRDPAEILKAVSAEAVDGLIARLTSFTEREYLRAGFEAAQGRGVGIAEVRAHVAQHLANPHAFVLDPESVSTPRYSTPEALAARQRVRDLAAKMKKAVTRKGVPKRLIERAIRKYAKPRSALAVTLRYHAAQLLRAARRKRTQPVNRLGIRHLAAKCLNLEQQKILTLLTRPSAHKLRIVKGSGDRTDFLTLAVAVQLWEKAGYNVLTLTHNNRTARGLKTHARIRSATIAAFGYWLNPSLAYLAVQHGKQLLRSAMKMPTSRPKKFVIDKDTVIFVHDADKLAADELSVIVEAAKKGGGRLNLLGEPRTLRQEQGADQSQAQDQDKTFDSASKPDPKPPEPDGSSANPVPPLIRENTYLDLISEKATVKQSKDHAAAVNALIADWVRLEGAAPQNSLILCDTKDEARYMNRRAQAARLAADAISSATSVFVNHETIYVNDRVQFTKHSRPLGLKKGDFATVLALDTHDQVAHVRLDTGREVLVPLRDYSAIELGYAATFQTFQNAPKLRAYALCSGDLEHEKVLDASRLAKEMRLFVHGVETTIRPETASTSAASKPRHVEPAFSKASVSHEPPELTR